MQFTLRQAIRIQTPVLEHASPPRWVDGHVGSTWVCATLIEWQGPVRSPAATGCQDRPQPVYSTA
jgi:hypothetical protein